MEMKERRMAFVVYNTDTTILLERNGQTYATKGAAKAALTRYSKKIAINVDDYSITDATNFYANVEKKVTRKNLMSGLDYQEPVNTPIYMSPASETYWSM